MRRHPSLVPLSDEHHQGLVQARHLSRVDTAAARLTPQETADNYLDFWDNGGKQHFRKEEECLLPIYSGYAEINTVEIINMLLQHVEIRRRTADLRRIRTSGGPLQLQSMQELGRLYNSHIKQEERLIFPMMEAAIPHEVLLELGEFPL